MKSLAQLPSIGKQCTKIPADLITFTQEILNGKLHFLCSERNTRNSSFTRFIMTINLTEMVQVTGSKF